MPKRLIKRVIRETIVEGAEVEVERPNNPPGWSLPESDDHDVDVDERESEGDDGTEDEGEYDAEDDGEVDGEDDGEVEGEDEDDDDE